jgi:hypothetical protein
MGKRAGLFRTTVALAVVTSLGFPAQAFAEARGYSQTSGVFASIAGKYFVSFPRFTGEWAEGESRRSLLVVDAVSAPTSDAQAATDATGAAESAPEIVDVVSGASDSKPFLGFKNRTSFHRFAGWTSGALLLAAGIVGAVRLYDLMEAGHKYRDEHGIGEDEIGDECSAYITDLWESGRGQALRWTHVSLIAAGETLYLTDAVTGIEMMKSDGPGVSKRDIHRYAFFVHGALMIAEAILGVVTTEALRRGDHETVTSAGIAHAGIGFAIPVVILSAGAVMQFGR